jgi:hypothetical protein
MLRGAKGVFLIGALTIVCGCSDSHQSPAQTFAAVSVQELRSHPDAHEGEVFAERFTFNRIWWGRDRARAGQPALDLPTHFTARIAAAPLYVARIEFPPDADATFENMRQGTDVRLQVRFLRLHAASQSPVFALEKVLPMAAPSSDLEHLRQ